MTLSNSPQAVVTGAGSGIGLATGRRLVREGFSVIAIDRDDSGLERAAAAGSRCLVNAAGIIVLKPILEVTIEDLETVYRVNVQAVWDLTARIGSAMAAGGSIVNLSSSSAKLATTTEAAAYASTKAAVLSLTRSFAYAFAARDVRVNAVCPGIIDTPMQDAVLSKVAAARGVPITELVAARNAVVPLNRATSADECASTIWFLLSSESSYMTGQAINVTGGLVMH